MFINLNVRCHIPKDHNSTAVEKSKSIKPKRNLKFHKKPAPNPRNLSYKGHRRKIGRWQD